MYQMSICAIEQMVTTDKILHTFFFIWQNGFNNKTLSNFTKTIIRPRLSEYLSWEYLQG